MGGPGSGRWGAHWKKVTVEDSLVLDVPNVKEEGGGDLAVLLSYSKGGENIHYRVSLTSVTLPSGGRRWYFRCPIVVQGRPCDRRTMKLYLPPGGLVFGCRDCHGLTYTSSQEAHRWDHLFAGIAASIAPQAIKRALEERYSKGLAGRMKGRAT